jgi:hypothetical protein
MRESDAIDTTRLIRLLEADMAVNFATAEAVLTDWVGKHWSCRRE